MTEQTARKPEQIEAEIVQARDSLASTIDTLENRLRPANLIQGLRDFFGAHTYLRTDAEGSFHTRWGQDGTEVRTDA